VRPTWKGFLKLSLVNIPVRMYPAARSESVSFNQIHKVCSTRIRYDKKCPTCNCSVSNDDIVKGYEIAKDQYVILDDEDFDKVRLESTKSIAIVQFVGEGDIDPLYYHGSHYLVPDGPVAVESFATSLGGAQKDFQIGRDLVLADVFVERARAQTRLGLKVFRHRFARNFARVVRPLNRRFL